MKEYIFSCIERPEDGWVLLRERSCWMPSGALWGGCSSLWGCNLNLGGGLQVWVGARVGLKSLFGGCKAPGGVANFFLVWGLWWTPGGVHWVHGF
jgi:hypothetical protein